MREASAQTSIVIVSSRIKAVAWAVVSMAFLAFAEFAVLTGAQVKGGPGMLYFSMVFFGACFVVMFWRSIVPAKLILSPSGLTWETGLKVVSYAWSDFAAFKLYKMGRGGPQIGFVLAENSPRKRSSLTRTLSGIDGTFGGQWTIKVADAIDLLNDAQMRWTKAPSERHSVFMP